MIFKIMCIASAAYLLLSAGIAWRWRKADMNGPEHD